MPVPHPAMESESEWMHRCVPVRMQEGNEQDQAVAVCLNMWRDATKAKARDEIKTVGFEVKALGERQFEGLGAFFGNVDYGDDRILPGAFAKTLQEHGQRGSLPLMAWMHRLDQIPGKWLEMRETSDGLYVRGETVDTPLGNEVRTLVLTKSVRGLSIGYSATDFAFDRDGVRDLKEIDLWEVSVVSLAMNPLAQIVGGKARISENGEYVPSPREIEEMLHNGTRFSKTISKMITSRLYSKKPDSAADGEDAEAQEVLKMLDRSADRIYDAAAAALFLRRE